MNTESITKAIHKFCTYMDLSTDELEAFAIENENQLIYQIRRVLMEYPLVLDKFLFRIFDIKTKDALQKKTNFHLDIEGRTPLIKVLEKSDVRNTFEYLQSSTGLIFPELKVPTYKYWIGLSLFVVPIIMLITLVLYYFDFFAVSFILLKWVFVTPILFFPYFIFDQLFPSFFLPSDVPNEMTYGELISELVILNH